MAHRTRVVWSEDFTRYDFGPTHPMNPIRLELTANLSRALGLFDRPGVSVAGADVASDQQLRTVHEGGYIEAVKTASANPALADANHGLGTDDDPAFVGMHESSARIFAGSVDAASQVMRGEMDHAVNFCGGMHHAMPDRASGFCIYNDVAGAIHRLLELGARKVVYVDVDVHHGDGVERIFWDEPRVVTISVHENGRALFPGTGWPAEFGGPNAEGDAVNIALPPGIGDEAWLRAIHAVVPPLIRAVRPDVLVTQHGSDSHFLDPLAHESVSLDGQRSVMELLHELSHEVCNGRWLATGGGGYAVVDVVPRAWTHLVGIAAHQPISPQTRVPQAWLDDVAQRFGEDAPETMTDNHPARFTPWQNGYNPEDAADRAVMATRQAVFPLHGLDPWFD